MRLTKIAAGAAALVLSTALIAGCGDKEDKSSSDKAKDTISKIEPTSELTKDNFAEQIGAAMVKAGTVHVKMTSGGSLPLQAEGDQITGATAADSKMALTMSVSGMKMDMRLIDSKLYINMDQLTQGKFTVIDLTDKSDPMVEQFGSLAEQTDLAKQFEDFGAAVTKFEKVNGGEKIDGVDTTAYDITMNAKKLAEAQGQDAAGMPETFTYRFFIGEDNLVRRMSIDVMGQKLTMDFSDWGKKVSIEAPKASEITDVDLSKLMSGAA